MNADQRADQLFGMLQRVKTILLEGRRSLARPDVDRWKALALARWDMLRTLQQLNRLKRLYVLDPIRMHGSEAMTERALRLVDSNFRLLEQYQHFVERWSLTKPQSVDEHYRAEARQMGDRIERQMEMDGRELDLLLHDSAAARG